RTGTVRDIGLAMVVAHALDVGHPDHHGFFRRACLEAFFDRRIELSDDAVPLGLDRLVTQHLQGSLLIRVIGLGGSGIVTNPSSYPGRPCRRYAVSPRILAAPRSNYRD